MDTLVAILTQYGAIGVFLLVLLVQLGLPIPVLPVLVLIGSLAVVNPQLGLISLLLAVVASLIGDFVWYSAGRRYGHRTLHLLCRISLSPDSCVRQTEVSFIRWGVITLVIAKFIPGLATLAPPLAGALGLRRSSFLLFSAVGAALWAGIWLLVGAIFYHQIHVILDKVDQFGKVAFIVLCLLLGGYLLYRWWQRYRLRIFVGKTQITPHILAELLNQSPPLLIFDARSPLAKSLDLQRIIGAQPIDPKLLDQSIIDIPRDMPIIVYCSCPNDVSAIQVTRSLQQKGYSQAKSLQGGIDAWRDAGFPVEIYEK